MRTLIWLAAPLLWVAAQAVADAGAPPATVPPLPVIIDTDVGDDIDDAFALAPLSNIEALARRHPDALRELRQVIMMGGSIHAGYNQGGAIPNPEPSAEYTVASAPGGLAVLLQSKVAVRMFPLDSTQIKFDEVRRDRLFAYGSPASDALALLYHQWRLLNSWGQLTPTLFDVVPVAWLLEPSTCPVTPLRIAVDERGNTRPVSGTANVEVCLTVDENATQRLIMNALAPVEPSRSEK